MKVELLYFDGCPSYETAYENLQAVLNETEIAGKVEWVRVESPEEAERVRFLGSPSIRINGVDVDRAAALDTDYGLRCRVYAANGDLVGWPSKEMIRDAVSTARANGA